MADCVRVGREHQHLPPRRIRLHGNRLVLVLQNLVDDPHELPGLRVLLLQLEIVYLLKQPIHQFNVRIKVRLKLLALEHGVVHAILEIVGRLSLIVCRFDCRGNVPFPGLARLLTRCHAVTVLFLCYLL